MHREPNAFDALKRSGQKKSNVMQQRHIVQIPCKPWTLKGVSDRLLVSHYENNYGAAVQSLNSIWDRLADLDCPVRLVTKSAL
jgi:hypothetical protein